VRRRLTGASRASFKSGVFITIAYRAPDFNASVPGTVEALRIPAFDDIMFR